MSAEPKPAPRWWHCDTHGPGNATAWGCPECVREMRAELATLKEREKACATMDEAQKVSLVRALQECCAALGLHAMASPADLVVAVARAQSEIQRLHLAEEGAATAFGHVVDSKRALKQEIAKLRASLQAAHDIIRRNAQAQQEPR